MFTDGNQTPSCHEVSGPLTSSPPPPPQMMEWSGQVMAKAGDPLAFDFETEMVDLKRFIPRPVVLSVACRAQITESSSVLVHPDHLNEFLLRHHGCVWVGHNVAFDWWVYYEMAAKPYGREVLRRIVEEGCLWDTQLMDLLLRLRDGVTDGFQNRSLAKLYEVECGGVAAPSRGKGAVAQELRTSFGQYLGLPLSAIPEDARQYALEDAVHTLAVYEAQKARLKAEDTTDPRWGPLSLNIQVKGALALAQAGRNGIAVDRQVVMDKEAEYRKMAESVLGTMVEHDPLLIKRYKRGSKDGTSKAGDPRITEGSGLPQLESGRLTKLLEEVALEYCPEVELPRTEPTKTHPKGQTATSSEAILAVMSRVAPTDERHNVLVAWREFTDTVKVLQFLVQLKDQDEVFPEYNVLVRTGRTSCRRPNIQQMPRLPWFRAIFGARPGRTLITCDYAFIELRTLAAVIEHENGPGTSSLATTIIAGRDPHIQTASIMTGTTYEEFKEWKKTRPDVFKKGRQAAKAVNFGVPGGLGARRLVDYARSNYDVDLSPEEAVKLRQTVVDRVFPELKGWLEDDFAGRLSATLGCPRAEALRFFPSPDNKFSKPEWMAEGKLIQGEECRSDGEKFSGLFKEDTWVALEHLVKKYSKDRDLVRRVTRRESGMDLFQRLLQPPTRTLTGRSRAGCDYGEFRNTKFQGLAADGAKLALWRLVSTGRAIVAFAHDEIVVEVMEDEARVEQQNVELIMNDEMEKCLYGHVPSAVESTVGDRWAKT